MAACGGESATPPDRTAGTVPARPEATVASTLPGPTSSVPAPATAPPPATVVVDPVEDGTFRGFLTAVTTGDGAGSLTYDRVEVDDISWLPGVLAVDAMTNENPRLRTVPIAPAVTVTLLCGGPLGIGEPGCTEATSAVDGSLPLIQQYLAARPYAWTAARAGIRTSEPYPPVFELRIEGGAVTSVLQRTPMPETVEGWSVDLGPWMHPAIEPCCGEQAVGDASAPFPVPGAPLPHTLYPADAYGAGWSPDRPDRLELELHRWVPSACSTDGTCDERAVEIDWSTAMPYALTLDEHVFVHVQSHACLAAPGLPASYVGDGRAFAALLSDLRADTERWLAAPVRAGDPLATALAAPGSPFEADPCTSPDRPEGEGEAVYHHTSGIDVLLQVLPMTPTGELGSPTAVVPVFSLGVDDQDLVHLFSTVGFRS